MKNDGLYDGNVMNLGGREIESLKKFAR